MVLEGTSLVNEDHNGTQVQETKLNGYVEQITDQTMVIEEKNMGTYLELFQVRHDIHSNTIGMIVDRGYESEDDWSRSVVNNEPSNNMKQPICEEKSMKSIIMI